MPELDLERALRNARPVAPPASSDLVAETRLLATGAVRPEIRAHRAVFFRRRLPVFAAAALIGLAAATVGAASRDWWFFHDTQLHAVSQPVVVASSSSELTTPWGPPWPRSGGEITGQAGGIPWELVAFVAKPPDGDRELCYGVTLDRPRAPRGGAINCSATELPGPGQGRSGQETHWLGFLTHTPGRLEKADWKLIAGPTNARVSSVDFIPADGSPITVRTLAAPTDFPVPVRFYVAALPVDTVIRTLVPRDAEGNVLERWDLSIAQ